VETYNAFLDEAFHFIGSTENEEFLNRAETTQFFAQTSDQLSGKTQLKNETKIVEQFGELVFVTHLFDAWFQQDQQWHYYNRFRFSNALRKNEKGWRFIYQHYSIPDSKASTGETIGFDQVSRENVLLREAIQRRTVELEAKNRELVVGNALERLRSRSMTMQHSEELHEIVKDFHERILLLGIDSEFSYVWLPEEAKGEHLFWATWKEDVNGEASYHTRAITYPLDTAEPYTATCFKDWRSPIKVHEHYVPPSDIEQFFASWEELLEGAENIKPEHFPDGIFYAEAFMQYGCFGIDIRRSLKEDEKNILNRFAKEFERAYTRFLDLQKAEALAREAKIESALEKIRNVALSLKNSDEMLDIAKVLYEQLKFLGFNDIRNALIDINDEKTETFMDYDYSDLMGGTVTKMAYDDDPTLKEQLQDIAKTTDGYSEMTLQEQQLEDLINMRRKNGEADDPRLEAATSVSYILYAFGNGAIGISNFGKLSEGQKAVLDRFRNVFTFAYNRFSELAKAEAQMQEVQLEASLEKVRSVALSMQKTDDMLNIAKVLYEELKELGFSEIRNAIIDLHNEDNETFWDYDYSKEMGGTITLLSYKNDPTLEEQYRKIIATTDGFYEQIIEGEALKEYVEMRIRNGEKDDPRLRGIDLLSYYLYSFGNGVIGISNFGLLDEAHKTILERFRNVFTFAYKRYGEIVKAQEYLTNLQKAKKGAEEALNELQTTQQQLIQAEKMASLGELTAGIAHEIQNPLNFVNNFSEVSSELLEELEEELEQGSIDGIRELLPDIKQNLAKITQHGKRADGIVKGMLQHSRKTTGEKIPTDINALCDEYLRLSYHGLRAADKSFNATLRTQFDESIGKIPLVPQDIGRVILNLLTNAFYACTEKSKRLGDGGGTDPYQPTVCISTRKGTDTIEIAISDNGGGIPEKVLDKIFQPFFTTKPTGQGTGLGLSMSYDIITKAHRGDLKVATRIGEGSTFTIQLPHIPKNS
jgi:signal transduction histidine kinase/coenzyme F420-reducing hydrogenase delta subunit/ketosteroid isomerase-like protein